MLVSKPDYSWLTLEISDEFGRKQEMNRFLQWLGKKLFGGSPAVDKSLHQTGRRIAPSRAPPRTAQPPAPPVQFDASVDGQIEDAGPGKNVLIRNRMVREDTGTHDTLKILDDSLLESEEEFGIDPYNTGRFDRSQSWNSRTRK